MCGNHHLLLTTKWPRRVSRWVSNVETEFDKEEEEEEEEEEDDDKQEKLAETVTAGNSRPCLRAQHARINDCGNMIRVSYNCDKARE